MDSSALPSFRRRAARATVRGVLLLSGVLTLVFLISFLFSEEGISELQESRVAVSTLQSEIARLEEENQKLSLEIQSIKESTFVVERIAREDLGMSKQGEIVYMLP